MTEPTFGLSFKDVPDAPRLAPAADMSILGVIGTAPDADPAAFPLNTPVEVKLGDTVALIQLGSTGTLFDALEGVDAQLGELGARIVVVRVTHNASADTVITNIVGSALSGTGLHAFKASRALLGLTPHIIIAPGYTQQVKSGVTGITVGGSGGSGYTSAPTVAFSGGGGGTGAAATATIADGKVTAITVTNPGSGYTSAPSVTLSGGAGSGATASASAGMLANSVAAALPSLLDNLLAVAVIDGPNTTAAEAKAWRSTLASKRLIPVEGGAVKLVDGALVAVPLAPRVAGLGMRLDAENKGVPSKSWANRAIRGIAAPARTIDFSLLDGATEGQDLLANNIGVLVRSEAGAPGSTDGGFVYIGTDGLAAAGEDQFYNHVRLRDWMHLRLVATFVGFLGRFRLTRQTVQAVENTMNTLGRDLKADGDVLDYRVQFLADRNSPDDLRAGKFTERFAAEPAPVLRVIGVETARMPEALDTLLADLLTQA